MRIFFHSWAKISFSIYPSPLKISYCAHNTNCENSHQVITAKKKNKLTCAEIETKINCAEQKLVSVSV